MTEPLTDLDQQLLAELTTAIAETTKRAAERIRAAGEAIEAIEAHQRTINRLQRDYRRRVWPIAFLTGALGGATVALLLS